MLHGNGVMGLGGGLLIKENKITNASKEGRVGGGNGGRETEGGRKRERVRQKGRVKEMERGRDGGFMPVAGARKAVYLHISLESGGVTIRVPIAN